MAEQLPPFAIRQLRNREPYSVLQITEAQYRTNVEDCPTAVLSYVDDDDGEKVTVGSSLELKQRLEEVPPSNAPLVHCYNSAKNEFEDRLVHLFDIQKTNVSRCLWRAQRRQYKKTWRKYEKTLKQKLDDDTISSMDLNAEPQVLEDEKMVSTGAQPVDQAESQAASVSDTTTTLSDAVPDLVDSLAMLLQTTSETLRRAAEKSRQSKTTPVEDVLSGVSNVVNEIGNFGLSLLDNLNDRPSRHSSEQGSSISHESPPSQISEPSSDHKTEDNVKDMQPSSIEHPDVLVGSTGFKRDVGNDDPPSIQELVCGFCSSFKLQCRGTQGSSGACHNCATIGHTCSLAMPSVEATSSVSPYLDQSMPTNTVNLRDDSILDQDTEDADFSRRYPPLISLRRANTIAGLHDRFANPREQGLNDQGLVRHGSWIKRYPHRPVPYVLDAETQRRRDFARHCFPAQKYTPGPGANEARVQLLHKDVNGAQPMNLEHQPKTFGGWRVPKPMAGQPQEALDKTSFSNTGKTTYKPFAGTLPSETLDTDLRSPFKPSHTSLPGAWPEPEGRTPVDATLGESSGAFFNRMMRDNPSRRQDHALDKNERLTRHRSFSKQKTNNNPFNELNRSRTISSTANPASRLNHPFEPLYPVLAPHNTEQPQTESKEAHKRISSVNNSIPEISKVSERPSWMQRPFSPVWEEHFNKIKNQNDKFDKLDQNKEFDSMYSPPPRHMRSVPNLATAAKAVTFEVPLPPFAPTTAELVSPAQDKSAHITNTVLDSKNASAAPSVPEMPYQVMFPRETSRSVSKRTPFSTTHTKDTDSGDKLLQCITVLQDMGYGFGDVHMKARLHVYAEAANGDVMEAVDMIEEDKKANFGQAVIAQLNGAKRRDRRVK